MFSINQALKEDRQGMIHIMLWGVERLFMVHVIDYYKRNPWLWGSTDNNAIDGNIHRQNRAYLVWYTGLKCGIPFSFQLSAITFNRSKSHVTAEVSFGIKVSRKLLCIGPVGAFRLTYALEMIKLNVSWLQSLAYTHNTHTFILVTHGRISV